MKTASVVRLSLHPNLCPDMDSKLSFALSFSIVLAAVIGIIRFNQVNKSFYPFIYLCWLALFEEMIAFVLLQSGYSSMLPSNIYVLIEALLLTWQFRLWGSFERRRKMYPLLMYAFLILWMLDNFIITSTIHEVSSYSRIGFSLALVILSIDQINRMIVRERKSFLTNAKFLICIAIIIFFSYKITIEVFYLYAVRQKSSSAFFVNIYNIQKYVNLLANLIYAFAALWIPRKKRYI
jgi:hypothetical protein